MAIVPTNIGVTVTTAGTRVQVTADTDIKPIAIYFETLATNTGYIYIGGSDVSSTVYMARLAIPTSAGSGSWSIAGEAAAGRIGGTGLQLSSFYVDSSVNGEKVRITYMYTSG